MKARNLLDKKVVDSQTGEVLGSVEDVTVAPNLKVSGLVVRTADGTRHLLALEACRLGPDSIMLRDREGLKPWTDGNPEKEYRQRLGSTVLDGRGKELGILTDLVLGEDGVTQGMEISNGLILDLVEGRDELPMSCIRVVGDGTVLVEEGRQGDELPGLQGSPGGEGGQ